MIHDRRLLTIAIALPCLAAACGTVRPPRDEVVGVLKALAKVHTKKDVPGYLALLAPGFRGEASLLTDREVDGIGVTRLVGGVDRRAFARALRDHFASFKAISKAKYVLDGIRQLEDGAWEVDCYHLLYAYRADGSRYHETTRLVFVFEPGPAEGQYLIRSQELRARTATRARRTQFVERSAQVGLKHRHTPHAPYGASTPVIPGNFSGSGAAAGDIDGDGDLDLVVGDGIRSRLFKNRGDGTFVDATRAAGLGKLGRVRGAYMVDYDDDGRLDLLFTRVGLKPALYRNLDGTRFEDVSAALAVAPEGQYESAAFGDLDGDGDLDLFLVRYGDFAKVSWAYPLYQATDGVADVVLENLGKGKFRRVVNPTLTPPGWGLAVAIADYDDDGDQDVYIVNDFGNNHLLRNDGKWKFTEVTQETGLGDQGFGMSAAFGDFDNDLDLDIYIANMNSSSRWVFNDPEFPLPKIADLFLRGFVRAEMYKVTRGNSLFRNNGDGTYTQVAAELGCERAEWAWGANFWDFDNDGDLDIYCPNGYVTGAAPPDQ